MHQQLRFWHHRINYTLTIHSYTKLGTEHQPNGLPTHQSYSDPRHSNLIITNPFGADTQSVNWPQVSKLCPMAWPHSALPWVTGQQATLTSQMPIIWLISWTIDIDCRKPRISPIKYRAWICKYTPYLQHIGAETKCPPFTKQHFQMHFLNVWIPIKISLELVPRGSINNIPALVQIMARRLDGAKPLSEPMMVSLPKHICVSRPQWVKVM